MKGNKKHGILSVRLQLALLVVLIVSGSVMIGTSFARYVASDSTSGNTRVSPFVVEAVGDGTINLNLDAGKNSDSNSFTVMNNANGVICEVTTEYDTIINLPNQLNSEVKMMPMKDKQELTNPVVTEDGLTYTYDAGTFQAAQGETHNFELIFKADNGITEAFDLSGIKISVHAE